MASRSLKILVFLLVPILGQAQFFQKLENTISPDAKLVVKLDRRNSFITTKSVKIFGLKAGVKVDENLELGFSYNFLTSRIIKDIPTQIPIEGNESFPARLKYRYLAMYTEYTFYRKDNWEFSVPFQVGIGTSFYKYRNELGGREIEDKGAMFSIEPGVEANYYVMPWLSFGLGIGYRIMLVDNPNIDEQFSAPLYVIKLNIEPKPAWKAIKGYINR